MLNRKTKEGTDAELERPKVYVTSSGRLFVKPEELLRSKQARDLLDEMAKLSFPRQGQKS